MHTKLKSAYEQQGRAYQLLQTQYNIERLRNELRIEDLQKQAKIKRRKAFWRGIGIGAIGGLALIIAK